MPARAAIARDRLLRLVAFVAAIRPWRNGFTGAFLVAAILWVADRGRTIWIGHATPRQDAVITRSIIPRVAVPASVRTRVMGAITFRVRGLPEPERALHTSDIMVDFTACNRCLAAVPNEDSDPRRGCELLPSM